MQAASKAFIESMKGPLRNRAYIDVRIGVVNQEAQKALSFDDPRNDFLYYSNIETPKKDVDVTQVYATAEENFAAVDGSMYFLPEEDEELEYYNNGIVTTALLGSVYVKFGSLYDLDIYGLTINFGVCYPTKFKVETDNGSYIFENEGEFWTTETPFRGVSYFIITAIEMVGGQDRLRINSFQCGVTIRFTNHETLNYTFTDYTSPIAENLPSLDMLLSVDNQNLYFSPDNDDSIFAFLEQGQIMKAKFGYDIGGDINNQGKIEWIPINTCFLQQWSATDISAQFTAVDIFEYELQDTYYKGVYHPEGISLYDLAEEVFADAGLIKGQYALANYMKKVIVKNPLPICKQSEAIQIIANAGRCVMTLSRNNVIILTPSFVPEYTISVNNQTEWSNIKNLLKDVKKDFYGNGSQDFTKVDKSLYFAPEDPKNYLRTLGYVSESMWIDDKWDNDQAPKITVVFEFPWSFYGLIIKFRNIAPEQVVVTTWQDGRKVQQFVIDNPELNCEIPDAFQEHDTFTVEITKGSPNARVFIESILINSITDYRLTRAYDLTASPLATRYNRMQYIAVVRSEFNESEEEVTANVRYDVEAGETTEIITFDKAAYDFQVEIILTDNVTVEIVNSGTYYCELKIVSEVAQDVEIKVTGKAYDIALKRYQVDYHRTGDIVNWTNPLISDADHAKKVEKWLADYYLGNVDYTLQWRGDPRVDANDLFWLELKDRNDTLIKAYQSRLNYSGAWSGQLKARKAAITWR